MVARPWAAQLGGTKRTQGTAWLTGPTASDGWPEGTKTHPNHEFRGFPLGIDLVLLVNEVSLKVAGRMRKASARRSPMGTVGGFCVRAACLGSVLALAGCNGSGGSLSNWGFGGGDQPP